MTREQSALAAARQAFADPPREYGMIPFWFWNDDLQEEELLRQIGEFHAKGFGGFIPHARTGLSRRVGYLTDEFLRLVRVCTEEAARLGMKVVLYDEGSYPSGSAQGRVVAANPDHAARCLISVAREVEGPARGFWRPNPGRAVRDELLCAVLGRETEAGGLDPDTLTLLEADEHEVLAYDVPEGRWQIVTVWHVFSGGTIRGVFAEEDDGHALAPAAGDILNPEAVASFLRFTHDAYYAGLMEQFGDTVLAMFTDEPSPLGRSPLRRPHPWPYTPGFLDDVARAWGGDPHPWLPALWLDLGPCTEAFRHTYVRTVYDRLESVFYGAQAEWCEAHGIALTGHPGASDEFGALRQFHWPGQDMVWRYVEPNKPTALEGPHSIAAKGAGSAAAIAGRPRNASEVLGAYGWQLSLDEAKWLFDWHLVRGNNTFFPHACFYSIRGRRAYESEPDIGVHNVWWPYFGLLGDYVRRLSWVLSGGHEVCDVALLTDPTQMAWQAARVMYRNQITFAYVDPEALAGARVDGDRLAVGPQRFRALLMDPLGVVPPELGELVAAFRRAGGTVIETWLEGSLAADLLASVGRAVDWPGAPDLRVLHYRKGELDAYLLVNEGEAAVEGDLSVRGAGGLELWDPVDGATRPWPSRGEGDRLHTRLRLERRQGLVLVVDPSVSAQGSLPVLAGGEVLRRIGGPWACMDGAGAGAEIPCPGDWAQAPGWETFSGTLRYESTLNVSDDEARGPLLLDLGRVGEIAEVLVDGAGAGVCAWAPYTVPLGHLTAGEHRLEVRVTNSMANRFEGHQRPSGLLEAPILRRGDSRSRA